MNDTTIQPLLISDAVRQFRGLSGTYEIVHLRTNKPYRGTAKDIGRRMSQHLRDMRTGNAKKPLQRAWMDGGESGLGVRIIEESYGADRMARETHFIKQTRGSLNIQHGKHKVTQRNWRDLRRAANEVYDGFECGRVIAVGLDHVFLAMKDALESTEAR